MKASHESLRDENAKLRTELTSLKQSLQDLEPDVPPESNTPDPEADVDPSSCLIIGDSMLRDFSDSTFENTCVKSISGATVEGTFKELEKRHDLDSFKNVIIHAGTNDISRNINVDETLASMEAIITLIMVEAPTATVFISGVCPRTKDQRQDGVEILNTAFKDLAVRLDCKFIDSSTHMTYRNGNIDETQLVDGLHLSARGCETLAKLFADSVVDLKIDTEPWHKVVRNPSKRREINSDRRSSQRGSRDPPESHHRNERYHHDKPRRHTRQRGNTFNRGVRSQDDKDFHRTQNSSNHGYTGCYNCGLKNHNQNTCRHKERVRCNKCHRLGHKANYCFSGNSHGNHGNGNVRTRY